MHHDKSDEFVCSWISSWNAHDIDSILSHYDEDVILYSPMIALITGKEQPLVNGRKELREYWEKSLELVPNLRFTIQAVLYGKDTLTLFYSNQLGRYASETSVFTGKMKVHLSIVTYSAAGSPAGGSSS